MTAASSTAVAAYKALRDCRAGGMLRRKGEVFSMEKLENPPKHLEPVTGSGEPARAAASTASPGRGRPKGPKGAAPDEFAPGKAKPAADVTSADMIKA